jgi:AraC-like DNA-binding protein
MNDTLFCKNFRFNEFCFTETQHRDNSRGVEFHFVGLMKQGRGEIVSRGQKLSIGVGEMFYIPKGCSYHSYWIAEPDVRFDSIGFLYFPTKTTGGYELQKIVYDERIMELFRPLSEDKTVSAVSIGHLYRFLGEVEEQLMPAAVSREVAVIEQFLRELAKDPHRSIGEYALLCGVSESSLYGYTRSALKKTPNRLRQETLCRKAFELLTATDEPIERVCDRLGFSSAAYFRSVYVSIYGKTPSQTRKENKRM